MNESGTFQEKREGLDGMCAHCGMKDRLCRGNPDAKAPDFCSTTLYEDVIQEVRKEYSRDDINRFAKNAAIQERSCYGIDPEKPEKRYPLKPRITEVIEFCRRMGYQKIGLAFCGGLHREAAVVSKIFENAGLQVVSVMCKVGGIDKTEMGLPEKEKIYPGKHESMCNPISQAKILNAAGTEFNVMLGLCVGHDSMFFRYSEALCTVLAVKDRLLGNNPLAAVYTSDSYYKYLKQ